MGSVRAILSMLRQETQYPQYLQDEISRECSYVDQDDLKRMVDLLESETKELLRRDDLGRSERKSLKWILLNIDCEERSFESVFCDEDVVFPDCLVDALERNTKFCCEATSVEDRIMYSLRSKDDPDLYMLPVEELEKVLRSIPTLILRYEGYEMAAICEYYDQFLLIMRLKLEHGMDIEQLRQEISHSIYWISVGGDDGIDNSEAGKVMDQLQRMNLLLKENIQSFGMIESLMEKCVSRKLASIVNKWRGDGTGFQESRFRYLVNWDPMTLTRENVKDLVLAVGLPLHCSVILFDDLKVFSIVLELGIKHFPKKFGFLFHENKKGFTPFALACENFGEEEAIKVVTGVLSVSSDFAKISLESLDSFAFMFELSTKHFPAKIGFLFHSNKSCSTLFKKACDKFGKEEVVRVINDVCSSVPSNTTQSMESLISLASDEYAHFESLYFVLCRDPSLLERRYTRKGTKRKRIEEGEGKKDYLHKIAPYFNPSYVSPTERMRIALEEYLAERKKETEA